MNKLKRASAGLLAIFLMAVSLSVLAPPQKAFAADPPDIWGNKNTSFGSNIKKLEAGTDREFFYIQLDRNTTDGREDYTYKGDSAEYSTTYEPRLITFERSDGVTMTADICQPKQILIQLNPDDDVGTKPYRYYFNETKTVSIDNFRDKMIEYNKKHPNYFWAGHIQMLESGACNNAKPIDLTPLPNRRIEATIDFEFKDTTQNRNDMQSITKGLTADELLKQLYVCPYHRISGEIVKTFDGKTPACVKIAGMSQTDILEDTNNTVKKVSWNTPDLTAGDYGVLIFGIGSDKFSKDFDFGSTGSGKYKTYAIAKDGELPLDFAAILREARARGDNFKKDVGAYEAIPEAQRLTDSASSDPEDDEITCERKFTNPLTYIMCPMVDLANELVINLDKEIVKQLNINEEDYFNIDGTSQTGNSFYGVWSNFRTIGLVLLVLAALVMVLAQALSIGPFDAYTVKKVLPRILVSIIFITLSWDICKFLISLSNDAGVATRAVIQTPFSSLGNAEIGSGSTAGAIVASVAGLTLGLWGMLSFLLTAAMAVIIAFFVLIIRKMVIVFLVLFAPFAIACYILPNTQKAYKFWWDTFSKGLLMFPIVMGFIAVGRAFAKVSGANHSLPGVLITMIAYFGPYFALPMAFRLAGGAIATISGMANDRGKGAFDRLKKFRQHQPAKRFEKANAGNLWRGNNAFSRRASSIAQGATMINKAGLRPGMMGSNMRSALGARNFAAASEGLEKNDTLKAIKNDDDKLWAVMEGHDYASIRKSLKDHGGERFKDERVLNEAVSQVQRVQKELGLPVARIAATRAQAATGTGFDDVGQMLNSINAAAGGDRSLSGQMLGEMRGAATQSGRMDLGAGGFARMAQSLDMLHDDHAGVGQAYSRQDATADVLQSAIEGNGGGQIIYGKIQSARQIAQAHANNLDAIATSVSTGQVDPRTVVPGKPGSGKVRTARELKQAMAAIAGMHDAAAQISPQNARAFADGVMGKALNPAVLPPEIVAALGGQDATVKNIISSLAVSGDADFNETRRDYGAASTAQGVSAQTAAAAAQAAAAAAQAPQPPQNPGQGQPGQFSDKRLKRNIAYLSTVKGMNIYQFQYLWSDEVYVGVMAQELLATHPSALHVQANGYYTVDYAQLGLRMMTLDEWLLNNRVLTIS